MLRYLLIFVGLLVLLAVALYVDCRLGGQGTYECRGIFRNLEEYTLKWKP